MAKTMGHFCPASAQMSREDGYVGPPDPRRVKDSRAYNQELMRWMEYKRIQRMKQIEGAQVCVVGPEGWQGTTM